MDENRAGPSPMSGAALLTSVRDSRMRQERRFDDSTKTLRKSVVEVGIQGVANAPHLADEVRPAGRIQGPP